MEEKVLTEIVTAHADQLKEERYRGEDYLTMFPDYRSELESLFTTAEGLKKALLPVKPDPAFREGLRQSLLAAAHRKEAERAVPSIETSGKGILIGAAVGSISVIGVIAYLMRARTKAQSVSSSGISESEFG
ncbi:MAG: hypothetical protein ACETWB_04840 [Anaerolineae bacterium]